jgi:hypothetical protein
VKIAKRRPEDPWSIELPRTLFTRDGQEIRTLADAGAYMLDLPNDIQLHSSWQHAARLVMDAAQGGDVTAATNQIALALLAGLKLDIRRTQPPQM